MSWARRSSGPQETTALAELPSREVLLAQVRRGYRGAHAAVCGAATKPCRKNLAYGLAGLRDKKAAEGLV